MMAITTSSSINVKPGPLLVRPPFEANESIFIFTEPLWDTLNPLPARFVAGQAPRDAVTELAADKA